jgi:exonuclease III
MTPTNETEMMYKLTKNYILNEETDSGFKITNFNIAGVLNEDNDYELLRKFLNQHKRSNFIAMQEFRKDASPRVYEIFDEYGFGFLVNTNTRKKDIKLGSTLTAVSKNIIDKVEREDLFYVTSETPQNEPALKNIDLLVYDFDGNTENYIHLLNVYIPNNPCERTGGPRETLRWIGDQISMFPHNTKKDKTLVCGDFNVPMFEDDADDDWFAGDVQCKYKQEFANNIIKFLHFTCLEDHGVILRERTTFGGHKGNTARIDYCVSNMVGFTAVDQNNYGSQHKALVTHISDITNHAEEIKNKRDQFLQSQSIQVK